MISLLIWEQITYRSKKDKLPGDRWTIPIIGKFASSLNPTLEGYQRQWDSGALSALSVFNIFIVIASTNQYTRKILNSPTFAEPCLVHSAKQILETDNWVFLTGKVHSDYRRVLNTLFTRKALALYLEIQDRIARDTYKEWLDNAKDEHESIMTPVRDFNMEVSLKVFCGPHIPKHAVKEISHIYWKITKALELVNFPLAVPGTKVYGAIQSRKVAMKYLTAAAEMSKAAMAAGGEPQCLIDQWAQEIIAMNADADSQSAASKATKKDFSAHEIAQVVLSFLFASQDAMSSGIIYMFQHLADQPEVLAKIREEQIRVRGSDLDSPMTLDMYDDMPYLRAAVRESLRVKPPVTMVPYKTIRPFPISDTYTVPLNTMVIPSLYPSLLDPEVYADPHEYKPERWLDPESPAWKATQNWLVFGAGPHKCIGQEYTLMNMAVAMGTAANMMNWEHKVTPDSNITQLIATIFPKDGCLMKFSPRK